MRACVQLCTTPTDTLRRTNARERQRETGRARSRKARTLTLLSLLRLRSLFAPVDFFFPLLWLSPPSFFRVWDAHTLPRAFVLERVSVRVIRTLYTYSYSHTRGSFKCSAFINVTFTVCEFDTFMNEFMHS